MAIAELICCDSHKDDLLYNCRYMWHIFIMILLTTSQICDRFIFQDQNLYGKIFGGFLIRKALETGWANAFVYR